MFLDAETLLNDGDECVGLCMFEFNFSDQSTHDCRQTCGASATDKMNRSLACDGVKCTASRKSCLAGHASSPRTFGRLAPSGASRAQLTEMPSFLGEGTAHSKWRWVTSS